ncbi:MAG TPA: hypothetical protein VLN45_09955 [Ignavibacteriaceae bacterium]|nr:hypothetical protein [Ignavibacteriaceae bacterium]
MLDFKEGDLNPYIEKSYKIALQYFRSINKKVYKLLNYNENTIEDLALDAIAPLFTKDGNFELPIKNSYNNWDPVIETEEELTFFLNKTVANRVEQHLTILFKESDPLFATIFSSVTYLIRKNRNAKTKYFGKIYIIESGLKKIEGKVITEEDFNLLPAAHFKESDLLLRNLFFYLKTETDFFPAIPLNALVLKFKELKSSGSSFEEKVEMPVSKRYELRDFVEMGIAAAQKRISISLMRKRRLSKDDVQNLFKALQKAGEDLLNGGVNPMFDYLKPYYEDLTMKTYVEKYHKTLEYMFKVMRNTIADELRK